MGKNSTESRVVTEFEKEIFTNIGKNVRYARRNILNITLANLSANTGVSRDVICRLEYLADGVKESTVYPGIPTIIKFCEGVGVSPSDLFDKDFSTDIEIQNRILEHCKGFIKEDKNVMSLDEKVEDKVQ